MGFSFWLGAFCGIGLTMAAVAVAELWYFGWWRETRRQINEDVVRRYMERMKAREDA